MIRTVALLIALAAALPVQAAEFNAVDPAHSSVGFVYKQMGVPVDGRFKKFSVQLAFDPAKPAAARATIDIELASVDTGSPEGDDEVAGKQWFNTKAFPTARFVSTAVKALGGNRYEVTGQLTIKGRTREVTAPFSFAAQGSGAAFDGGFVLKRADFAIGEGVWADFGTVANEIQIKFHVLAMAGK